MTTEDLLGLSLPALYLFMLAGERLFPARRFPRIKGWSFIGAAFLVLAMATGILAPFYVPVEWLAAHRLMDGTKLGVAGGAVAGFLAFELVFYFYHRIAHRTPLLWRGFHQMHHAPQRLDISGALVFHPLELMLQNVMLLGVSLFVFGLEPMSVAIIGVLMGFYGLFQHWNVKTPVWLGYIVQRPEAHCRHHQLNVHASNYADVPLIDMLFGTFENPRDFEGAVGFEDQASYARMLAFVDVNAGKDAGQPTRSIPRATSISVAR
jgi:sterol desaturase/sphingolipid hydroxylase (fatty acid hydroxylase superfamily)